MPALYGALAAFFCAIGLAAIPMLRDQGPVERLGGRAGAVREERGWLTARLATGWRCGSGRGWRPRCARAAAACSSAGSTTRAGRAG